MRMPWRRDDGAAAVEFALVGSLLLIPIVLAILAFGFYFFSATTVNSAVRDGARTAAVGATCADWEAVMRNRLAAANWQSASMTPRTSRLTEFTVTVTWTGPRIIAPFPTPVFEPTSSATHRVERVPASPAACSVTR